MKFSFTRKILVKPDSKQAELLVNTGKAYAEAYNYVSGVVFETRNLNRTTLHKQVYRNIRTHHSLPSQMACSVIRSVISGYKTTLTNQKDWIKSERKSFSYDLVFNRDYSFSQHQISVNTLKGRIKLPYDGNNLREYLEDKSWKLGEAKLVYQNKKFYLHISVSKEIPELENAEISNITGVDLGVNFLAVSYNSKGKTKFFDGRKIKHKRAKFKNQRKALQKKKTASSRRKLKRVGQRENRWMQDVNHQVSKALVENSPGKTLFVLEDLTGIRNATKKVRLEHRYVFVSWAFYDLRRKLEYKAALNNQKVIAVNPKYTSQTCPKCGHISRNNRNKKLHTFCCKNCGYAGNDDRVAAMNLHRKGLNYLSSESA